MSKVWFRYGLWAATLFVAAWVTALVSALAGGKGIDKMKVPVDGTVPGRVRHGKTADPYAYEGPEWAGDGCQGRPLNLGIFPSKGGPSGA